MRPIDIPTTMPYFDCPSCGKTAMRVANRCPHCGLNFTPEMIPPAEPSPFRGVWVVAGALLAVMAVVVVARNWIEGPAAPPPPAMDALAPPERQAAPPATVTAPPIAEEAPAPAPGPAADSASPAAGLLPHAAPPPVAPSSAAPTGEQHQRYATTWVNVRDRRGPEATPVRVLEPGEAVLVDSLLGGWYRVMVNGAVIGYAYGSNLGEGPP